MRKSEKRANISETVVGKIKAAVVEIAAKRLSLNKISSDSRHFLPKLCNAQAFRAAEQDPDWEFENPRNINDQQCCSQNNGTPFVPNFNQLKYLFHPNILFQPAFLSLISLWLNNLIMEIQSRKYLFCSITVTIYLNQLIH